jgi:hypothetical protein
MRVPSMSDMSKYLIQNQEKTREREENILKCRERYQNAHIFSIR